MARLFRLLGVLCLSALLVDGQYPSLVTIPGLGDVKGVLNSVAREFRGLPYAAPPERWRPPAPVLPWSSVLDATHDGAGCMQVCRQPPLACPATISEDCLFLNVFTPLPVPPQPQPVSVFIHGGNFRDGFGGGILYNGSNLAAGNFQAGPSPQQAVVVAINYRLGAFGFLSTNVTTGADAITGNYGLADQREALRWVQAHISAFGGDPGRVLLWGQSAGAMSVAAHLISPLADEAAPLFTAALAVSEPFALPFRDAASATAATAQLAFYAGCPAGPAAVGCLRSLPAASLLAAQAAAQKNVSDDSATLLQAFMPWTPTVGAAANSSFSLPNWPLYSFQGRPGAAPVADVPLVVGTVSSEGTLFIDDAVPGVMSELEYYAILAVMLGSDAGAVAAQYPPPSPPPADFVPLTANVTTAGIFRCATRNATRELVSQPDRAAPVYLYEFSHLLSFSRALNLSARCIDAVCHGSDLPMWWHPTYTALANYTDAELALAGDMGALVNRFAATGTPGGAGSVVWAPVTRAGTPRLQLDVPALALEDDPGAAECVMWDRVGYTWPAP